jgi:hypothetical protein
MRVAIHMRPHTDGIAAWPSGGRALSARVVHFIEQVDDRARAGARALGEFAGRLAQARAEPRDERAREGGLLIQERQKHRPLEFQELTIRLRGGIEDMGAAIKNGVLAKRLARAERADARD